MVDALDIELRPQKTLGYHVFRVIIVSVWYVMFRPTVVGRENIPLSGPVMIAPIHRSNLDFAFTVFMTKRKGFFMAKDAIWKVPVLANLVSAMGAFPVKRGTADRDSMEFAQRVLNEGHTLVLFPEGTRQEGLDVGHLHDGAMFLATRAGAPVVPVGIGHTERAMPKGAKFPRPIKVSIVIGKPIIPPTSPGRVSRSQIGEATEQLRAALQDVYSEAMQA